MPGKKNSMELPGLGQVGIVTKDIDKAIKQYEELFGIGPWLVSEGGLDWLEVRGQRCEQPRKVALAQAGTVQLELIQKLEGEIIHDDFLGERGEGVHHLGFFVSNIEERIEAAKKAGIEVIQQGRITEKGLTVRYAYLDTTSIAGVIVEFLEARFLGIRFPMRSPLLRWGNSLAGKIGG